MTAITPEPWMTEPRGCPTPGACSAVDEITRLRAYNANSRDLLNAQDEEITRLRAQRDQLLAALKEMIDWYGDDKGKWPCVDRALAAIAAVEDRGNE